MSVKGDVGQDSGHTTDGILPVQSVLRAFHRFFILDAPAKARKRLLYVAVTGTWPAQT